MRSSNETRLRLELLEDRIALNGTFHGAIDAGPPSLTPFPFNGLTVHTVTPSHPLPGFRDSFADVRHLVFSPAPPPKSHPQPVPPAPVVPDNQNPMPTLPSAQVFQSQMQAFQAAQTAMIDQFISEFNSMLQTLRLQGFVIM